MCGRNFLKQPCTLADHDHVFHCKRWSSWNNILTFLCKGLVLSCCSVTTVCSSFPIYFFLCSVGSGQFNQLDRCQSVLSKVWHVVLAVIPKYLCNRFLLYLPNLYFRLLERMRIINHNMGIKPSGWPFNQTIFVRCTQWLSGTLRIYCT